MNKFIYILLDGEEKFRAISYIFLILFRNIYIPID